MNYDETLEFLYARLQSFHNVGAAAYKPGLDKAYAMLRLTGNPHTRFRSVHVGGTNGKGSTSHSIASVLMAAGLKVGLYTSPHLVDFAERIRIDGRPIPHREVVRMVEQYRRMGLLEFEPSFFELTTVMAFDYFARNNVDIAVVEVGLGGRLDTTNVLTPVLSVITNISMDHTALLGNSYAAIAAEKAGIIKPGVPAVIGRRNPETDPVFMAAATAGAQVYFAQDNPAYDSCERTPDGITYRNTRWGDVHSPLAGDCQPENMNTVLTALAHLPGLTSEAVRDGLANVLDSTGLMGRWQTISQHPRTVVDTGHNVDAWKYLSARLEAHLPRPLYCVLGFVNDKDYASILAMLPRRARYFIVMPSVSRAAASADVAKAAEACGLQTSVYTTVEEGYAAACREAGNDPDALVFVGGSTFVVADIIARQ